MPFLWSSNLVSCYKLITKHINYLGSQTLMIIKFFSFHNPVCLLYAQEQSGRVKDFLMKLKVFYVSPIYSQESCRPLQFWQTLSLDIITTSISTRKVSFSGGNYKIFIEIIHFYNMHDIMDPLICVIYAQKQRRIFKKI